MENKLEILKIVYTQQHTISQKILDKISSTTTWVIGILLIIDGSLVTEFTNISTYNKFLIAILIVALCVATIYLLKSKYNEFSAVAKLILRVEEAMHLYEPDFFIPGKTLFPQDYKCLGDDNYEHSQKLLYSNIYLVLTFGVLSLVIIFIT